MCTIKQRRPFQKVHISYDLCKTRTMELVWISMSIHVNGSQGKGEFYIMESIVDDRIVAWIYISLYVSPISWDINKE